VCFPEPFGSCCEEIYSIVSLSGNSLHVLFHSVLQPFQQGSSSGGVSVRSAPLIIRGELNGELLEDRLEKKIFLDPASGIFFVPRDLVSVLAMTSSQDFPENRTSVPFR